ncbi:hypothetical protein APUTEX25_000656, partial [Auxenochlorella protothecoides]
APGARSRQLPKLGNRLQPRDWVPTAEAAIRRRDCLMRDNGEPAHPGQGTPQTPCPMDVDVVAADDAPSTSRPLASAGQDSQTPPVQLDVVNKLDDAEKRDQQWQNDATVNEWRTAPGEAGTKGRYGKTTWNGFRDLSKKKKKKKEKKKKKKGQQQQQQQPVLDALRSTVDDVVAVISELRTVGDLFATFHAIRMVEEFERRKQAGRADADAALQPFDRNFFS